MLARRAVSKHEGLRILHASRGGSQRCFISGFRGGVKNSPLQVPSSVGHSAGRQAIDTVKSFFIPLVCLEMLLSGLLHLFLPGETEKHMSCPRNARIVGAILLALVLPATVWGFYVLAVLFVAFGLPRLFAPERSILLQQRFYPRRVHGALLVMAAVGLWIVSRLVHG